VKRTILLTFCVANFGIALAQQSDDGGAPRNRSRPHLEANAPEPLIDRYLVTYLKSRTDAPRSATVVTVINQSKQSCSVKVNWFAGFQPDTAACTSAEVLNPGVSHDFCSRDVLSNITTCNTICDPELTFIEGKATVSSSASEECSSIAVDARVYYTTGDLNDTGVAAVSNPKVVRARRHKRSD
jgi:hypothetical protein